MTSARRNTIPVDLSVAIFDRGWSSPVVSVLSEYHVLYNTYVTGVSGLPIPAAPTIMQSEYE